MAHVNTQVREVFASRLAAVAGMTSVFSNRGADILDGHMPAAVIATERDEVVEDSGGYSGGPALEKREVDVAVTLVISGTDTDTIDDDVDGFRAKCEAAIAADADLGGLAFNVFHTGAELEMGTDEEGERWYAFLTMTWMVQVWTERGDPETARG